MRQITIKEINELSQVELDMLLENKDIQNWILEEVLEWENDYAGDILECVTHSLSNYEVGAYRPSYLKINDELEFLKGLQKASDDYGAMYDDQEEIKKAIMLHDELENLDENSNAYIEISLEYKTLLENLKSTFLNGLLEIIEYFDSFEKVDKESDYVQNWIESYYDREVVVEDDKVYLFQY